MRDTMVVGGEDSYKKKKGGGGGLDGWEVFNLVCLVCCIFSSDKSFLIFIYR